MKEVNTVKSKTEMVNWLYAFISQKCESAGVWYEFTCYYTPKINRRFLLIKIDTKPAVFTHSLQLDDEIYEKQIIDLSSIISKLDLR